MKPFEIPAFDRRGASLGRYYQNTGMPRNLRLQKVPLDAGGYDPGGAYWGCGKPLYCTWTLGFIYFVRAPTRHDAKKLILEKHPEASFLR